jgi:heme-degrading monooxygenase HmoA
MYLRANQVMVQPDRVDDVIRFVQDEVVPVSREQRDTRGLAMSVDRDAGRCSIVSFWDNLDAVQASEASVSRLREEAAQRFGATFEVNVLEQVEWHVVRQPEPGCWNRISMLDIAPADIDAAIDAFRISTLPALEAMTGFCAAVLAVDREHGRAVAATMWQDHDALRAGNERANALREEVRDKAHGTITAVLEQEIVISAQVS